MIEVKARENFQKALELYYESAERGNAVGQLQLAKMFRHGVGVERDDRAALEWFLKSALQGNAEAQAHLGSMHEKGLATDRDLRQARQWYEKSAAQGNALGQARLAGLFLAGAGVEQNLHEALAWYRKAAAQGNDEAQAQLGHMYEKGLGANRDIRRAAELYRSSAEQENPLGLLRLGDFHLNGIGVEKNPRRAFACFQKAAAQDRDPESAAEALLLLGAMYCQGSGVERDLRQGFACYEKSARLGNADAQLRIGAMYNDGVGVERDPQKAREWLRKSAGKSKAPSNSAMGDLYRDGLVVEKNVAEAVKWYKKAAAGGDAYARRELLKLQLEESAPAGAGTVPAPAGQPPARKGVEKGGKKAPSGLQEAAAPTDLPASGRLQPARRQKGAGDPLAKQKAPERTRQRPAPARTGKAPARSRWLYPLSAVVVLGLALAVLLTGFGEKPAGSWKSLEIARAEVTDLPRPDPGFFPPLALAPPGDILKIVNARAAAPGKGGQGAPPAAAAAPEAVPAEPAGPLLRSEYRTLDESEIAAMLAARNLFDAQRNPGGNFPHRYELRDAGGLRLIHDGATGLVWTRQQNPVRMSLAKSREWIASLNRVGYGGIRSWRLPTLEEAASLLRKDGGKIFLDAIFGEDPGPVWTGDGATDSEAWIVDFRNGTVDRARSKSRLAILMVSPDPD